MTVKLLDISQIPAIKAEIDNKTKPLGSLGKIEDLALRLGLIYGSKNPKISEPTLYLCAGNHGITESGVSAYPSEVTAQMLLNFANGGAAINVLSEANGIHLEFVNAGVDMNDFDVDERFNVPISAGTKSFATHRAMTSDDCRAAVALGKERVLTRVQDGSNFTLLGEMGIGNSSSAAVITSLITGVELDHCVGRGTGLSDEMLRNKKEVLSRAISFHGEITDPMEILEVFGGLEIAALVGVLIASAENGLPILVDGFITTSAALIAAELNPNIRDYLIFSHVSLEPGHKFAVDHLLGDALLNLNLRLGEGSGAALAFPLVNGAAEILSKMATFQSASVSTSGES